VADARLHHARRRGSGGVRGPSPPPTRSATSYAMGGRPIMALNIVNFPARGPCRSTIWRRSCAAAPAKPPKPASPILGGHSVDDPELKYGMVVLGTIHPDKIVTNAAGPPRRYAGTDQAARHRRDHDGDQGAAGRRCDHRASRHRDDDAESGGPRRRCWRSEAHASHGRDRLRTAGPPSPRWCGGSGVGAVIHARAGAADRGDARPWPIAA